jgi:hypothetical protein
MSSNSRIDESVLFRSLVGLHDKLAPFLARMGLFDSPRPIDIKLTSYLSAFQSLIVSV